MKRTLYLNMVLVLSLILTFTACKKEVITANGHVVSEDRNVGQFTGLNSDGSTPVRIKYGISYNVRIKGSTNIIPYFTTRVVNNKLNIGFDNAYIRHDDIEVEITMPTFNRILLSGSGKVEIEGAFETLPFLNIGVSGSGDVLLNNYLDAHEVDIEISGSGKADFKKLNAKYADVSISGSGHAFVQVEEKLKAHISGSGKIYYAGNPLIEQYISGSGKVIRF
ncbi:head GIN domain-containing protein [Pedobacter montanisoli]|uniref:DUF2807 domain-containing protein n=1 Tax=Pedobacter montanisoli TaxID=2923277 RepID=A0ABS9ZXX0_9SPHI|nr:head GIN domain-containing protein [Pedobacter montanisoli]MCJ0743163.1 DUF2807 domain-containing protein [Pedobacter montanisoli]